MQVILLSRILEKLERMEKRMDKIETRVEEIAGTAVGKMPGQAGHNGKRKEIGIISVFRRRPMRFWRSCINGLTGRIE